MPYEIRHVSNGYKVCKQSSSKCFSSYPMTYNNALAQLRAIQIHSHERTGGFSNELSDTIIEEFLKGGEDYKNVQILGVGNSACVYSVGDLAFKVNFITPTWKRDEDLLHKRDSQEFMNLQKKILDMDPFQQYFCPILDIKTMDSEYPPIQQCLQKFNERQIIMGRPIQTPSEVEIYIQKKVIKAPPLQQWSKEQLEHALQGLFLLHKHDICHTDIHIGNYGLHRNLPVLIDMDSAWYAKPFKVGGHRGSLTIKTKGTKYEDLKQFKNMVS
jgi:hypothetical protein